MKVPHVANIRLCAKAGGHGNFDLGELPNWEIDGFDLNDSMFTLSGGIDGSGSFTLGALEDSKGFVTGLCPKIKLNMPCPLKKLKVSGDSETDSKPYVKVESCEASSSGCAKKFKVSLKMPEDVFDGTLYVLTGFDFTGDAFTPQVGTLKFKHGLLTDQEGCDEEPKINVTFAQHQCC